MDDKDSSDVMDVDRSGSPRKNLDAFDEMDLDIEDDEQALAGENTFIKFATDHVRVGLSRMGELQSEEKLRQEWQDWDEDTQHVLMRMIRDIIAICQTVDCYEDSIEDLCADYQRHAVGSSARLHALDLYDNALEDTWDAIEDVIKALRKLKEYYEEAPKSIFRREISWRTRKHQERQNALAHMMTEIHLEELHPAKRMMINRKVPYRLPADEEDELLESLSEMSSKIPKMPAIVRLPGSSDVTHWHLGHTVREGRMNKGVDIMIGVDHNQTIVERRARKKIQQPSKTNPYFWRGDLNDEGGRTLPHEYVAHRLMSQEDAQYVIKVVSDYRYNEETRIARIYMEYAPHSDLDNVLDMHKQADERIPEGFLWLVFRALVETVFIMKYGSLNKDNKPDDWLEIVHRDIKPGNMLLSASDPTYFKMFPTPKVSDFGLSVLTTDNDTCNPRLYVRGGTEGYFAPEQLLFEDPVENKLVDAVKMLSPCNVWAIGATMYALMTLTALDSLNPNRQLPYCITTAIPTGKEFELDVRAEINAKWPSQYRYSPLLVETVQKCLCFQARDRITIEKLKQDIEETFAGSPLLFKLANDYNGPSPGRLLHKPARQEYRKGMVYPPQ